MVTLPITNIHLLPEYDIRIWKRRARIFMISLLLRVRYSQSSSKPRGPS